MITPEKAQAHLNAHIPSALTKKDFKKFSAAYRVLAELVALVNTENQPQKSPAGEQLVEAFKVEDPLFNPWRTEEGMRLAVLIFGAPKAHLLPTIWDGYNTSPYQTGYSRRPFRRSPDTSLISRKVSRLHELYRTGLLGYAGLDVFDTARYAGYKQWQSSHLAVWYAAALQEEETAPKLRELLEDIIQGEDEIGLLNRGLINGLLLTEDPENWKLVEQLLIAAQREEGLRQTILESLDETSIGALESIIGVIIDHDLARFSSVVRAVDVWFGLAWEAPKKATVNRMLTLVRGFLNDPPSVAAALAGKDTLEIYVGLWTVALADADAAVGLAANLLKEGRHKQLVAFNFISETERTHKSVGEWMETGFGNDPEVDRLALYCFPENLPLSDHLFAQMSAHGESLPKEGKTFSGSIFSWQTVVVKPENFYQFLILKGTKAHLRRLCEDLTQLPSDSRQTLLREVFPAQYRWSLGYGNKLDPATAASVAADPWKRELVRQAAADRNGGVMATGILFLGALELESADKELIIKLLRRKGKELRAELIRVILGQPEAVLKEMVSTLLVTKSVDQRLAGLEIMTELHDDNKLMTFVLAQTGRYRERSQFSKNEEVLLEKLSGATTSEITYENGFGTIDFNSLSPLITPEIKFGKEQGTNGLTGKLKAAAKGLVQPLTGEAFLFPKMVNTQKLTNAFQELFRLLKEHGKHEYKCWYNDNYSDTVLLENVFGLTDPEAFELEPREKLKYLPLPEVWQGWYDKSGLNDFELLYGIHFLAQDEYIQEDLAPFKGFLQQYYPDIPALEPPISGEESYTNKGRLANLFTYFLQAYGDLPTVFQFQVDMLEDMTVRMPAKLRKVIEVEQKYGWKKQVFWASNLQRMVPGNYRGLTSAQLETKDIKAVKRLWELQVYLMGQGLLYPQVPKTTQDIARVPPPENSSYVLPGMWATLLLFEKGMIAEEDLLLQGLLSKQLFQLLDGNMNSLRWVKQQDIVVPQGLLGPLKKSLLDLELQRGDLPTEATPFVTQLHRIVGMEYLFRTLERLGKENLHRGYHWGNEVSKKVSFSGILKKSIASETDTAPAFRAAAKASGIPKSRWFEVAMYAPQWAPWIADYLKIPDLELAVWWFHAHAADYMDGQKEKIVSQFSPIDKADFGQGAIDVDWFYVAYQGVGKKHWKMLHDAAKYISDGNGHRQVKTYSAVMLGEIKIRETLAKIKDKRDKVYVKALGLVPLSRTRPEQDLLTRYKLLQEFIRESRQFGAQRQESEKTAARIGLENLARNVGFDDITRFSWIMEAEATRAIMDQSIVGIDNVTVQLIIDEDGKAGIIVAKDGKPQKTIPAKYRKAKAIVALQQHKTDLRRQFSRTRKSLEQAMLAGTTFTTEDLAKINQHPIVKTMLAKLVLFLPERGISGFWREGNLIGLDGQRHRAAAEDELVIAHPAHLYRAVEWDLYQRYAFELGLVQPFKQIFRELYLITPDEKEEKIQSRRYQGHQIQPKKSAALLRGRGWTISDTEGLQKVYHKRDVIATMYAMADWYSPAEVEAPAIEGVVFQRRDGTTLALESLDPVLFSEVMRDIDLVVSVAHVGGVDPEASHSTLEMRGALARESARLFKADNVEVKDRFIVITGKLGSYNIHLGSGMVTKGGLQLNIIPVHSQHRGRLFLPFLDDDPKSAEIISKMKLLAEDDQIKDPTVLGQIVG
ncbi:MAG: DUF5724 domain-containing protein [Lewinella sp.]